MECQFFEGKNEARLFRAAATAGSDCWPVGYFLDIFRFVVCTAWCDSYTSVSLTHTYQLETRCATVKTFIISQTFIGTALQCPNSEVSTCLFVANLRPGDTSPSFWKILKCMDSVRNFLDFFFQTFHLAVFFRQGSVGVKKAGWHVVQCLALQIAEHMYIIQILYSLKLMAKCTWTLIGFWRLCNFFFREPC